MINYGSSLETVRNRSTVVSLAQASCHVMDLVKCQGLDLVIRLPSVSEGFIVFVPCLRAAARRTAVLEIIRCRPVQQAAAFS